MTNDSFAPTAELRLLVENMAAVDTPLSEMVLIMPNTSGQPITEQILREHFQREIDTGKAKANFQVKQALLRKAIAGDVACLISWLETHSGADAVIEILN